jgi:uncharacterized protein YegL
MSGSELEAIEFLDQQPRCACVLLLDTSGSMGGPPITALNAGLQTFKDELNKDDLAKRRVEVAIVEFNSVVNVVQDFITADQFQPPSLTATGGTDMVGGIQKALDIVKERKEKYKSFGIKYYRPWVFMITDGFASGYEQVALRIKDEEEKKQVAFWAVGVQGADIDCLKKISLREPKMLAALNFRELFVWLSASMQRVSQSKPGDMVPMPKPNWDAV